MANELNYPDRFIKTCVTATYYDATYIQNALQNTVCHYRDIENVNIYKNYNSLLTEDIIVKNVNFLYFSAQREVLLELTTDITITLQTLEFYLYQPKAPFSFKLTGSQSEESCPCFIHLFYADTNPSESGQQLYSTYPTSLNYER